MLARILSQFADPKRGPLRCGLVVAALYLAIVLPFTSVYPLVFEDEVTLNEPARTLAAEGVLKSDYFSLTNRELDFRSHFFWQPPGQALVVAASYKLLGFGLVQTRLPGILAMAGCLIMMAALGGRLGGSRVATLATLALALNPQAFRSSINARMDTLCWLALLCALWVLWGGEERQGSGKSAMRLGCSGLLVGCASMMHVLTLSWALGLGLVLILRRTQLRGLLAFAAGCGLPVFLWLLWAWPSLDLWYAQFVTHGVSRMSSDGIWGRLLKELLRNGIPNAATPLLPLLFLFGLGFRLQAWTSLKRPERDLLVLAVVVGAFVALLMGKIMGEYNVYYQIPLCLLGSVGLVLLADRLGPWRPALAILFVGAVLWSGIRLSLPGYVARFAQREARNYTSLVEELRPFIGKGDHVGGSPEAWYACAQLGGTLHELSERVAHGECSTLVVRPSSESLLGPDYVCLARVGHPLPLVFGKTFSSNSYQLSIWRSLKAR